MATANPPSSAHRVRGIILALTAVIIWAGWIVATRHVVTHDLLPHDIGVFRYGVPALVLSPLWWPVLRRCRLRDTVLIGLMVLGSGLPFLWLVANGMARAPAGHAGALLPGTMPLWAALIGIVLFRDRPSTGRVLGLAAIAGGLLVLTGSEWLHHDGQRLPGHLMLIGGACLWAIYTHAFKRSGLGAAQAAGLIAAWSTVLTLIAIAVHGTRLPELSVEGWLVNIGVQGILSGLVAIVAFGAAVRDLGAVGAATFTALVPVLAIAGGVVFLGEEATAAASLGAGIVAAGVALSTGALGQPFGRWWRRQDILVGQEARQRPEV